MGHWVLGMGHESFLSLFTDSPSTKRDRLKNVLLANPYIASFLPFSNRRTHVIWGSDMFFNNLNIGTVQ
ncbi:MAG: hypothetical protein RMX59_028520 [Nostoc sp. DedSLP05]